MFNSVTLKFGTPGTPQLTFAPATMTLFVGPNGSGKSLALREVQQYAEHGPQFTRKIVDRVRVNLPDEESTRRMLHSRRARVPSSVAIPDGHIRVVKQVPTAGSSNAMDIREDHLLTQLNQARQQPPGADVAPWAGIFSQFVNLFTVALDGKNRFALVEQRAAGDLQGPPVNHLAALFQDDIARAQVRQIVHDAFGLYFVIDPTHLGQFRIRMASRAPIDPQEEQALDARARDFHATAAEITDLSDGVKAFTGIISALASVDFRVIVIDEPEAFLHPPLARKLGYRTTELAAARDANVFAATHSADFLMGAVEAGRPLNVIRLTYQQGLASARLLPAAEVVTLMREPLLRSTNVLSALFHVGAVVCEADADRCFYSEVNARLLAASDHGVKDSVFLNAQNKQTVRRIVGPLRRMGIAAAALIDLDIIKGTDLRDLLNACGVPDELQHALTVLRGDLETHFEQAGLDMKAGGLGLLNGQHAESCRALLTQLATYGIFLVPNGEVESWLAHFGLHTKKNQWLAEVFDRMGSDPASPQYLQPTDNDVWGFVRQVATWVSNPQRLGMPAD